ncbi:MAG: MFS transporter [Streptosporangiales bacterium]
MYEQGTETANGGDERSSILRQPKSVWAVAFACVIAFMGIGLVDPILKPIAEQLDATPSQVELLFSSYMLVTGVTMLITGVVSSRIGPKKTLLCGLALIIVFSFLAGSSGSINEIVGFRGGWGLGNALFIATALAAIVGSASGGVGGAIILYEAALGVGISTGPLLGGLLGEVSWRGPFFGVAVLMSIAFIAIVVLLPKTPPPKQHTSIADPFRALGHRPLLTVGLTALCYNFGFFTLLGYTPFPLGYGAIQIGLIFCGWGVGLAITSVFVAPVLQRKFGTIRVMLCVLLLFAFDLVGMALLTDSKLALVIGVVVSGLLLGINNTLITQTVMLAAPVERSTASAAYSFVRFGGGAVGPWLAGILGESISPHVPFWMGAGATFVAVLVLFSGRRVLAHVDDHRAKPHSQDEAVAVTTGDS